MDFPVDLPLVDRDVFLALAKHDLPGLQRSLAAGGRTEIVRETVVTSDHDRWVDTTTPLIDAIRMANGLPFVNTLINAGANVFSTFGDHSAIRLAMIQKKWDVVHRLMDAGAHRPFLSILAEPIPESKRKETLNLALCQTPSSIVQRLIQDGCVYTDDPVQMGWLHALIDQSHPLKTDLLDGWRATFNLILHVDGSSLNMPKKYHGNNLAPLAIAASKGLVHVLEALLEAGATVNQTAHLEIFDDLSDSPQVWEDRRITALHLAASHNHAQACEVLLRHGADPTLRSETPWTDVQAHEWLFDYTTFRANDAQGLTPLETAQANGANAAAAVLEKVLLLRSTSEVLPVAAPLRSVRSRL